jgi:hypothetical protein
MADFQQRHYEALAKLMQAAKVQDDVDQQGGLDMMQRMMCELLAQDNPKFDRARFERACEPGRNVRARK